VILISDVTPAVIGQEGGCELELELGENAVPGEIAVYLNGLPCYGGHGYGYTPHTDGSRVTVWSPQIAVPGVYDVTVVQGVLGSTSFPISVLERGWPSKQLSFRASFPHWMGVGPRRTEGPL